MRRTKGPDRLGLDSSESEKIEQFRGLLELLELERRKYAKANVPNGVQRAFGALLKHLNRFSSADILTLYGQPAAKSRKSETRLPSVKELSAMPLEEIEGLVANEATPRRLLEEIAVARFHFPRGSLRSLANMKLLKEKIDTRIRNERAHHEISSAAQRLKR
jgi:hypothetical protein